MLQNTFFSLSINTYGNILRLNTRGCQKINKQTNKIIHCESNKMLSATESGFPTPKNAFQF